MKIFSEVYPALQPYELDQFRWKESNLTVRDLPKRIGADFIKEPWNGLQPKFDVAAYRQQFFTPSTVLFSWGYNGQEKTLLMYHDSFGNRLQSFLHHHFKAAMYIPDANPEPPENSWIVSYKNCWNICIDKIEFAPSLPPWFCGGKYALSIIVSGGLP